MIIGACTASVHVPAADSSLTLESHVMLTGCMGVDPHTCIDSMQLHASEMPA